MRSDLIHEIDERSESREEAVCSNVIQRHVLFLIRCIGERDCRIQRGTTRRASSASSAGHPVDGLRDSRRRCDRVNNISGSSRRPVILIADSTDSGRWDSAEEIERASEVDVMLATHERANSNKSEAASCPFQSW